LSGKYAGPTQKDNWSSRRYPAVWLGVVAMSLAIAVAFGTGPGGDMVTQAAEMAQADPSATSEPAQSDQTPVPVLDLPSLSSAPVALAVALDAALNAGDVGAVLDLFDDGAQVKIPPDVYNGATQIRNWASYLAANHYGSEPGLRHLDLARGSITWPAEVRSDQLVRFGLDSLHGEATLVVRGGKIGSYTFVLTRESAGQLRAAQIAASDVLQDPLIVGAEFANVYGPNDVFHGADGALLSYRDVVAAEPGSGPFFDLGGQPIVLRTGL
jgi:hypothetical protein